MALVDFEDLVEVAVLDRFTPRREERSWVDGQLEKVEINSLIHTGAFLFSRHGFELVCVHRKKALDLHLSYI